MIFLFFGICTILITFSNANVEVTTIPAGPDIFPVEGSKFVVTCIVEDSSLNVPVANFQSNKIDYTNTTDKRIVVVKTSAPGKTTVVLTINNITASDIWDSEGTVKCKTAGISSHVSVYVIPKESVPEFQNGTSLSTTAERASNFSFICSAVIKTDPSVKKLTLEWRRSLESLSKPAKLGENVKTEILSSNSSAVTSVLTISNVGNSNAGKYYCLALLELTNVKVDKDQFYKTFDITEITYEQGTESSVTEKKVQAGEDYTMDCDVNAVPLPVIQWRKSGEFINSSSNSRYTFSSGSSSIPDNQFFSIKDITYTDRGVYECIVQFKKSRVTKSFTLRVRDPLGPLWPVLGILAEAVILAFIIFIYEMCKGKKKTKKRDSTDNEETSPLVSDAPAKVFYTSGTDGVRTRSTHEPSV